MARSVRSTTEIGSLDGTIVVSIATRRPRGGAFGTGSFIADAKTQTAKFCTRRMLSTQMTTQKLNLATPSRQPPNPTTPGPGTCEGSSSQAMNATAVRALIRASVVSTARWAGEATRRKEPADRTRSPAVRQCRHSGHMHAAPRGCAVPAVPHDHLPLERGGSCERRGRPSPQCGDAGHGTADGHPLPAGTVRRLQDLPNSPSAKRHERRRGSGCRPGDHGNTNQLAFAEDAQGAWRHTASRVGPRALLKRWRAPMANIRCRWRAPHC
jgi:hypothetical protein